MKKSLLIPIIGALFLTPAMALSHSNTVNAAKSKGTITIMGGSTYSGNAKVYDKNNKWLTQYEGKKKPKLDRLTKLKYYGIEKGKLYKIGKNAYIRKSDIAFINNYPTLELAHNAFVYDKHGKRIKHFYSKKKNTVIKKKSILVATNKVKKLNNVQERLIKGTSKRYYFFINASQFTHDQIGKGYWLPYRTINHKKYYSIGNGGYIKAANLYAIANQLLFVSDAKIRLIPWDENNGNFIPIYNHKFYVTRIIPKKDLKKYKTIISDYFIMQPADDSDIYNYYHIKGTKDEYISEVNVGRIDSNQSLNIRLDYSYTWDDVEKDATDTNPYPDVIPKKFFK